MSSTSLPPELHAVARAAARDAAPFAPPRTATILGLGHFLPAEVLPNGPIAERIGVDDEWIVKRTGIHARRKAGPEERTSDLATFAARRALTDAGVEPEEIDLVLVATMSQDEATPNTAPIVANAIGAGTTAALDVGAACTGWLAGVQLAASQIESGRAEKVLVIGAETLTRMTDLDDKKTAMLFGDGAAAVVVGVADSPAVGGGTGVGGVIGSIQLQSDGSLAETITAVWENRFIHMDGVSTFKTAVKNMTEATVAAVARSGWELDDVDLFVYHQANGRIIKAIGERLDVEPARIADYIAQLGNTSAASIPLTLSLAREDGRLRPGMKVLLAAMGAGLTWGAGTVEWGLEA